TLASTVAADTKVISGSMCVPWYGFGENPGGTPTFDGKFALTGTEPNKAICPILRDHNTERLSGIFVRIAAPSGNTSCEARTISGTGSAYYATDPGQLSGTGSIFLDVDDIPVFSGGSYWVTCSMNASTIVNIRW